MLVRKTRMIVACAAMAFALFLGTGGYAQDVPERQSSRPNIAGCWSGTDSGKDKSNSWSELPMTLTNIQQDGESFNGDFMLTTDNDTPTGTFSGKFSGDTKIRMKFQSSGGKHPCVANAKATIDTSGAAPAMTGSYVVPVSKHCQGKGTFKLTQQNSC